MQQQLTQAYFSNFSNSCQEIVVRFFSWIYSTFNSDSVCRTIRFWLWLLSNHIASPTEIHPICSQSQKVRILLKLWDYCSQVLRPSVGMSLASLAMIQLGVARKRTPLVSQLPWQPIKLSKVTLFTWMGPIQNTTPTPVEICHHMWFACSAVTGILRPSLDV